LPPEIDWNRLKIALAIIQYRFGMLVSAQDEDFAASVIANL
jgi:hypothetical protein